MAGTVQATPGFALQPSAQQVPTATNYIKDFDFANQYLPDTDSEMFMRYGNQSIAEFLRLTSAEKPTTSDLIKWSEEGRLHIKYTQVGTSASAGADTAVLQINDTLDPNRSGNTWPASGNIALRVGQTVLLDFIDGSGSNHAVITAVDTANSQVTVSFYEGGGLVASGSDVANADMHLIIYGSEFGKGTAGMSGRLESDPEVYETNPITLKDNYAVSGSDTAQIGWVEVDTDEGSGYLWFLHSLSETRKRFNDYLETSMIEAVPAETGSGAISDYDGTNGVFYTVEDRGNLYSGGNPDSISDWDSIISRLDKQGSIQENAVFVNRNFSLDIDDMLAAQSSATGTSYGMFNNDENMALNLGFKGFSRGSYEFYKSDWKYLNDPTMRGDLNSNKISGLLVPVGTTSVYDEVMGQNVTLPFLHVRYRASQFENRRYKTWVTGSVGAETDDIDEMRVNFLSERAICTLGANNFFLFKEN